MKTIANKLIAGVLGGVLLLGAQACTESFLERKPQGEEIVEDFFNSEDGAIKATNAIYAHLRTWQTHVFAFIAISNITSDDADKGSVPTDAPDIGRFDNFTVPATSGIVNDFWVGQYQGVNRCNEVIERVPAMAAVSDTLKRRLDAEAKFLRAYFYFNLVRTFGGVPRITRIVRDGDPAQPRATREEIYQLIEQDLNEAITVLPEKDQYPPSELGRATKGAAKGLLAKVAMYQRRWNDVLRLTDEIITSGKYNLNTPYEVIFTEAGENTSESLFEVQNAAPPQCTGGSQYAQVQAVRDQFGWGFNTPSEDLINRAYEPGDPRREATILFAGERLSDGVTIIPNPPNPAYNQKAYVAQNESRSSCGIENSNKNIRILRYADIVLMNAEAANELGNGAKAAEGLNAVRARARGGRTGILPDVAFTNQEQMRQAIWQERRVELAMEHDRFWDLVRQGRAAQVLQAVGKNFRAGINEVMPIPQTQIDASGNVLTQNPGY